MNQEIQDFIKQAKGLTTNQLIALADLYAEQASPGVLDTLRRDILEAEIDRRERELPDTLVTMLPNLDRVESNLQELEHVLHMIQGVVREPITDKMSQAISDIREAIL